MRLVQMSSQGECYQAANAISNAKLRVWLVYAGGGGSLEGLGGWGGVGITG